MSTTHIKHQWKLHPLFRLLECSCGVQIPYRELRQWESEVDYYQLPRHKQWLSSQDFGYGSPHEVGGRATDITEIGHTLKRLAEEAVDGTLPSELECYWTQIMSTLVQGEKQIQTFIGAVNCRLMLASPEELVTPWFDAGKNADADAQTIKVEIDGNSMPYGR